MSDIQIVIKNTPICLLNRKYRLTKYSFTAPMLAAQQNHQLISYQLRPGLTAMKGQAFSLTNRTTQLTP